MKLTLRMPDTEEFQDILDHIREFELDDRDLQVNQFIAAFRNKKLVGFGRLRKHSDGTELCSLGVITPLRRKGIGKAIVTQLIKGAPEKLYLVCIIPDFFTPFNFRITSDYPSSLQDKLDYCTNHLVVPEKYVVMKLNQ
jgi:N-acetylglutamate synthase-like GNAT family acetyltransferase